MINLISFSGLNTKVAQVVAKELGISVDMIKIKPTDNFVGPNNSVTGGSMGSECCASVSVTQTSRRSVCFSFMF